MSDSKWIEKTLACTLVYLLTTSTLPLILAAPAVWILCNEILELQPSG